MDTDIRNSIVLDNADCFYTKDRDSVLRVIEGTVYVYLMPWEREKPGRKILLCEIPAGKMIPSFCCEDRNRVPYCFAVVPKGHAVLTEMTGMMTSVLQERFLTRCGIDSYRIEGFEGSLFEFYNRELLKNDVYLLRGERAAPEINEAAYEVIRSAFDSRAAGTGSQDPLYAAVAWVCRREGIRLLPLDKISALIGRNLTVSGIADASQFIARRVVLPEKWYKKDIGPVVGALDGEPVAFSFRRGGGYSVFMSSDRSVKKLTPEMAARVEPQAYSIKRGLPKKSLTAGDVADFCAGSVTGWDLTALLLCELLCVVTGLLLPALNRLVYDRLIPEGIITESTAGLRQVAVMILSCMAGSLCLAVLKNLAGHRITSKISYDLQDAVYNRVFQLPEGFFRSCGSADLGRRIVTVSSVSRQIASACIVTVSSAAFALIYAFIMGKYAEGQGGLVPSAIFLYICYGAVICLISVLSLRDEKRIREYDGEARSRLYQYLNAIEKIRLAGVEDRAAYAYLQPFSAIQSAELHRNRFLSLSEALTAVSSAIFSGVFYMVILRHGGGMAVGSFVAFSSAFGMLTASFGGLLSEGTGLIRLRDDIKRIEPIFTSAPEDDLSEDPPGRIKGRISAEHVSFSYEPEGKEVLHDVSFDIDPGEYVGIVGASGCGKSTLLKLLLGFETPASGMILYDGKDLKRLNKNALRKQLGVVLQNGRLVSGSIYENITITSPGAAMEQVEAVLEKVGLKEDIARMPMGVHTVLNESSGTISGGQQQRILIARAIMAEPSILIFDEATSALDNISQAMICANLDKMNATRVIVAHRLSTVRNCDRILVLNNGRIAEEGNYDSLMEKKGLFWRLASRQIAE